MPVGDWAVVLGAEAVAVLLGSKVLPLPEYNAVAAPAVMVAALCKHELSLAIPTESTPWMAELPSESVTETGIAT